MRTKIYNAIIELLSDGAWHPTDHLWRVTTEPVSWLKLLSRDPHFEYDASEAKIRLLSVPVAAAQGSSLFVDSGEQRRGAAPAGR
jgi:hypothetical protein